MSGKTRTIGLASLLLALLVPISAGTAGAATGGEDRFAPGQNQRIAVYGSPFGKMIYNSSRQAIYQFDRDSKGKSRCYGSCARLWPPVLTRGKPRAIRGARANLLGTIKRKGGARQVTYNGWPLYYYEHEQPGQVFCHNVFLNGGLWKVIRPNGRLAE
jgi:predicted lipoprotein with Yx(FWY)xxD motif